MVRWQLDLNIALVHKILEITLNNLLLLYIRMSSRIQVNVKKSSLTIDHHCNVHKIDLPACLYAGFTAVHTLVSLGHLMDLQVVVWQHLEPAFTAHVKRRTEGQPEKGRKGEWK